MRALRVCLPCLVLSLGACKPSSDGADTSASTDKKAEAADAGVKAEPEAPAKPERLGANASEACRHAMTVLGELDAMRDTEPDAAVIAETLGRVQGGVSTLDWVGSAGLRLGRMSNDESMDVALINGVVANLSARDPDGLRYDLAMIVTQLRAVALLELRRLLGDLADAKVAGDGARAALDEAHCLWEGGMRALAKRADALPTRGGENWEASIDAALTTTVDALDNPTHVKTTKQRVEKGMYAVAYRLILANAEAQTRPAASEALGLLDALEDRLADRNGPGLKRMRQMFNGDPAQVHVAKVERELAVAFTKRARKYCDKAIQGDALATPATIAETWEGIIYTRVILPSMAEALSAEGFDADAYMTDWEDYLAAIEAGDTPAATAISPRLVEWNCAYQDHLGIAACSASSDEVE